MEKELIPIAKEITLFKQNNKNKWKSKLKTLLSDKKLNNKHLIKFKEEFSEILFYIDNSFTFSEILLLLKNHQKLNIKK